MRNNTISVAYLIAIGVQIISAFWFALFSDGLYAMSKGGLFHCKELLSSGRDDELMLVVFILMAVPAIVRAFRFNYYVNAVETLIFFIITAVCVWILSTGMDCGEFSTTLIEAQPLSLLVFSISGLSTVIAMLCLLWQRDIKRRRTIYE